MKKILNFSFLILVKTMFFAQIPAQMLFNKNNNFLPITTGLSLWFDAADAGSLVKDASNKVSLWQDKSPNANHAVQINSANQPTYKLNQQNGLPCVIFTSNANYMVSTKTGNYRTIFAVRNIVNSTSGNSYQTLFASPQNSDFSLRLNPNYDGTNGLYRGEYYFNDWTVNFIQSIYVNGVNTDAVPPRPNYHIVHAGTSTNDIRINQTYSLSTTFNNRGMVGGIAELLVYDRFLDFYERRYIAEYLSRKWNIPITPLISMP